MARPVVALLTDFGLRDHYVGAMKGVLLDLCPELTLVDITHDIPPHRVDLAALELAACYRYFPAGTIFLTVVDPGVGSARLGLAAEAGELRFVAPDNGVLTLVFEEHRPKRLVELSARRYARPTVSRTFEGRDRFAPAAAWLARGVDLSALGRPVSAWHQLSIPVATVDGDCLQGEVVRVDRFGNLVTNIDRRLFDRFRQTHGIAIAVEGREVGRLVAAYAEAPPGEVAALFGSTDHLELAVNSGSAAELLGCGCGASVQVVRSVAAV